MSNLVLHGDDYRRVAIAYSAIRRFKSQHLNQVLIMFLGLMLIGLSLADPGPNESIGGDLNDVAPEPTIEQDATESQSKVVHSMKYHPQYPLVRKICNNDKVDIGGKKLMQTIVAIVQLDTRSCKERYDSSIRELDPILNLKDEELCSDRAIDMMERYHFRFIQPLRHLNILPTREEEKPRGVYKAQLHPEPRKYTADFEGIQILMTPIAIRHFFLKFALQVSYTCKRNLVANLIEEDKLQLNEEDKSIMRMFQSDSPLGQAFADDEEVDFDDLMYIEKLDGPGSKLNPDRRDKEKVNFLKVHLGIDSDNFKIIAGCRNRFAPVYEKLIMPIMRLSKMGYDYRGDKFSDFEKVHLKKGQIRTWASLIHVCELFKNFVLYDARGYVMKITADETTKKNSYEETTTTNPIDETTTNMSDIPSTTITIESKSTGNGEDNFNGPANGDKLIENHQLELDPIKDLKMETISGDEAKRLQTTLKPINLMLPNHYEMTVFTPFDEQLMITSEKQLDYELSLKPGHLHPFGFRGFMRNTISLIKKALSKLDMERFAHFRQNSTYYNGLLSYISALSNVGSITVTIIAIVAANGG